MRELSGLHPQVRARADAVLAWAAFYGVPVRVVSGFRTLQEQRRLRSDWLAGLSKLPANRPGDSAHNFGLAFDSSVQPKYQDWYTALRQWAGFCVPANDVPHAEVCGWRQFVGR